MQIAGLLSSPWQLCTTRLRYFVLPKLPAAYRDYISEIRCAFADLGHQVDEVYWMGNEAEGWLISTRWSVDATHTGDGIYRSPTQARCQIWGIIQWRVQNAQIKQEWQLFNEFDVMMQVARARSHGR